MPQNIKAFFYCFFFVCLLSPCQGQISPGIEFFAMGSNLIGSDTTMVSTGTELRGNQPVDMMLTMTNTTTSTATGTFRMEWEDMWPGDTAIMDIPAGVTFIIEYPTTAPFDPGRVIIEWSETMAPLQTVRVTITNMRWGPYNGGSHSHTFTPVVNGQSLQVDFVQYFEDDFHTVDVGSSGNYAPLIGGQPGWDSLDVFIVKGGTGGIRGYGVLKDNYSNGIRSIGLLPPGVLPGDVAGVLVRDTALVTAISVPVQDQGIKWANTEMGIILYSQESAEVQVINLQGKVVHTSTIQASIPLELVLPKGVYVLQRLDCFCEPITFLRY